MFFEKALIWVIFVILEIVDKIISLIFTDKFYSIVGISSSANF